MAEKLTPEEIKNKIADAAKIVKVGGRYQHYKGAEFTYIVTDLVLIEENQEVGVIYEPEYFPKDATSRFFRPLSVWTEVVEWEGQTLPRFKPIE